MKVTKEELAGYLEMAEKAHKVYEGAESGTVKVPWPTFYAEWILDNTKLGINNPLREWDTEIWNDNDRLAKWSAIGLLTLAGVIYWAISLSSH